ncbi:MAG: alpha/beta hydrolase [Bacillaceae bacterium]
MFEKEKSQTFTMSEEHHSYQIHVYVPNQSAPEGGFPVLYILDGNAYFTMLQQITALQSRRPEKTGIEPMILVGVGYEGEGFFNPYRVYDFTPPASTVHLPKKPNGEPWSEHGGANSFLRFIEEQLKPTVERLYSIHPEKQTLFGHSLGGLFVLYTLFNRSDMFNLYFACSPSIWWNEQSILRDEENIANIKTSKRLFIAAEKGEKAFMYEDAFSLYNRISSRYTSLETAFFSPDGENHMSIVPAVFSKGMRFLYS